MKDTSKRILIEGGIWVAAIGALTAIGNAFTMSEEKRDEQTITGVASVAVIAAVTAVCVAIIESHEDL